jgi:hypothetical protein
MPRSRSTGSASTISRSQVAAFRLARHHLIERAPLERMSDVVAAMCGSQAQLASAAELSIAIRTRGLHAGDVLRAIRRDRTLARTWCMRSTLHLVPADRLATFARGCGRRMERSFHWMRAQGVRDDRLQELIDAVPRALDRPRTSAELVDRVGELMGLSTRMAPADGWASRQRVPCLVMNRRLALQSRYVLLFGTTRGVLCSGPDRDDASTYVRADAWLDRWKDLPVDVAEDALLRCYLRSFGPANPQDYAMWSGIRLTDVRRIWGRVESALSPVDVDGWRASILTEDLPDLRRARLRRPSVRLLPYFDSFLLAHRDRTHLVATQHHRRVYRPQGWIAPVLLVDGLVAGVWSQTNSTGRLTVEVEPFARTFGRIGEAVRKEVGEIARYLGQRNSTAVFQRPTRSS